jgi:hypothetical protein
MTRSAISTFDEMRTDVLSLSVQFKDETKALREQDKIASDLIVQLRGELDKVRDKQTQVMIDLERLKERNNLK